jgi:hypothetical protein
VGISRIAAAVPPPTAPPPRRRRRCGGAVGNFPLKLSQRHKITSARPTGACLPRAALAPAHARV